MKIYSQDHSWRGMIVVVAETDLEAKLLMIDAGKYDSDEPITENEIVSGLTLINWGDS